MLRVLSCRRCHIAACRNSATKYRDPWDLSPKSVPGYPTTRPSFFRSWRSKRWRASQILIRRASRTWLGLLQLGDYSVSVLGLASSLRARPRTREDPILNPELRPLAAIVRVVKQPGGLIKGTSTSNPKRVCTAQAGRSRIQTQASNPPDPQTPSPPKPALFQATLAFQHAKFTDVIARELRLGISRRLGTRKGVPTL